MMNITQQVRNLQRIKLDLQKELKRFEGQPVYSDLEMQIAGLGESIETLQKVSQMIEAQSWLMKKGIE